VKDRSIISANVDGSDKQTLLDATQGLGFVEGRAESAEFVTFSATVFAPSQRILFNVDFFKIYSNVTVTVSMILT